MGAPSGLRERNKRRARAAILDAAERLIAERGYRRTTMRDVAERAELSYQTLYNYFPNKAALAFALLVEQTGAANVRAAELRAAGTGEPLETTLIVADLYVDLVVGGDRALWQEVAAELLRSGAWHGREVAVFDADIRAAVAAFYADCVRAGTLRADTDPQVLADVVYAVTDHAMLRFVADARLPAARARAWLRAQLACVLGPRLTSA